MVPPVAPSPPRAWGHVLPRPPRTLRNLAVCHSQTRHIVLCTSMLTHCMQINDPAQLLVAQRHVSLSGSRQLGFDESIIENLKFAQNTLRYLQNVFTAEVRCTSTRKCNVMWVRWNCKRDKHNMTTIMRVCARSGVTIYGGVGEYYLRVESTFVVCALSDISLICSILQYILYDWLHTYAVCSYIGLQS